MYKIIEKLKIIEMLLYELYQYGKFSLIDLLSDCSLYRRGLSQYKSLPQQYTRDRRDSSDALLPPRGKSEYT